jgi:hypothetical protein
MAKHRGAWNEPSFSRDVARLFRRARKEAGRYPTDGATPYRHRNERGATAIVLSGEGLRLLQTLTSRIVGQSRFDVGLSAKAAESLLFDACNRAVDGDGDDAALRWLISELNSPVEDWLVVEAVDLLLVGKKRLHLGRSTFTTYVPQRASQRIDRDWLKEFPSDCYVSVVVTARDSVSARVLAQEAFSDSRTLLDLIDPPTPSAPPGTFVAVPLARRGGGGISFSRDGWIIDAGWFAGNGQLVSPYAQLSRAFSKEESIRTDWERRVVASTRWLSRAYRSSNTADRLVSLMTVLEALLIESRKEGNKGQLIATRLTERIRRRSITHSDQVQWLTDLYARRNDAIHEGREYLKDIEVEDLLEMVRYTVRYAAEHLASKHAGRGRVCQTFTEAMACPLWYGARD